MKIFLKYWNLLKNILELKDPKMKWNMMMKLEYDDKTNFQDQEPTDYRLMNVTRDLQDAISDTSTAYDLNLVAVDPENFVSEFVDEVSNEFDEFLGF